MTASDCHPLGDGDEPNTFAPEGASRCRALTSGLMVRSAGRKEDFSRLEGLMAANGRGVNVSGREPERVNGAGGCYNACVTGVNAMKYVSLADARTNMAALLDEVERGETVVITPTGQPAEAGAELGETRRREARDAVERLMEMRKTAPPATT